MTFENHILYVRETCPFCVKVARYMESADVQCETRSITDEQNRQDLIAIGGKQQVPCLVINGAAMYESNDIIAYFREKIA